jgi:hypothetical protein
LTKSNSENSLQNVEKNENNEKNNSNDKNVSRNNSNNRSNFSPHGPPPQSSYSYYTNQYQQTHSYSAQKSLHKNHNFSFDKIPTFFSDFFSDSFSDFFYSFLQHYFLGPEADQIDRNLPPLDLFHLITPGLLSIISNAIQLYPLTIPQTLAVFLCLLPLMIIWSFGINFFIFLIFLAISFFFLFISVLKIIPFYYTHFEQKFFLQLSLLFNQTTLQLSVLDLSMLDLRGSTVSDIVSLLFFNLDPVGKRLVLKRLPIFAQRLLTLTLYDILPTRFASKLKVILQQKELADMYDIPFEPFENESVLAAFWNLKEKNNKDNLQNENKFQTRIRNDEKRKIPQKIDPKNDNTTPFSKTVSFNDTELNTFTTPFYTHETGSSNSSSDSFYQYQPNIHTDSYNTPKRPQTEAFFSESDQLNSLQRHRFITPFQRRMKSILQRPASNGPVFDPSTPFPFSLTSYAVKHFKKSIFEYIQDQYPYVVTYSTQLYGLFQSSLKASSNLLGGDELLLEFNGEMAGTGINGEGSDERDSNWDDNIGNSIQFDYSLMEIDNVQNNNNGNKIDQNDGERDEKSAKNEKDDRIQLAIDQNFQNEFFHKENAIIINTPGFTLHIDQNLNKNISNNDDNGVNNVNDILDKDIFHSFLTTDQHSPKVHQIYAQIAHLTCPCCDMSLFPSVSSLLLKDEFKNDKIPFIISQNTSKLTTSSTSDDFLPSTPLLTHHPIDLGRLLHNDLMSKNLGNSSGFSTPQTVLNTTNYIIPITTVPTPYRPLYRQGTCGGYKMTGLNELDEKSCEHFKNQNVENLNHNGDEKNSESCPNIDSTNGAVQDDELHFSLSQSTPTRDDDCDSLDQIDIANNQNNFEEKKVKKIIDKKNNQKNESNNSTLVPYLLPYHLLSDEQLLCLYNQTIENYLIDNPYLLHNQIIKETDQNEKINQKDKNGQNKDEKTENKNSHLLQSCLDCLSIEPPLTLSSNSDMYGYNNSRLTNNCNISHSINNFRKNNPIFAQNNYSKNVKNSSPESTMISSSLSTSTSSSTDSFVLNTLELVSDLTAPILDSENKHKNPQHFHHNSLTTKPLLFSTPYKESPLHSIQNQENSIHRSKTTPSSPILIGFDKYNQFNPNSSTQNNPALFPSKNSAFSKNPNFSSSNSNTQNPLHTHPQSTPFYSTPQNPNKHDPIFNRSNSSSVIHPINTISNPLPAHHPSPTLPTLPTLPTDTNLLWPFASLFLGIGVTLQGIKIISDRKLRWRILQIVTGGLDWCLSFATVMSLSHAVLLRKLHAQSQQMQGIGMGKFGGNKGKNIAKNVGNKDGENFGLGNIDKEDSIWLSKLTPLVDFKITQHYTYCPLYSQYRLLVDRCDESDENNGKSNQDAVFKNDNNNSNNLNNPNNLNNSNNPNNPNNPNNSQKNSNLASNNSTYIAHCSCCSNSITRETIIKHLLTYNSICTNQFEKELLQKTNTKPNKKTNQFFVQDIFNLMNEEENQKLALYKYKFNSKKTTIDDTNYFKRYQELLKNFGKGNNFNFGEYVYRKYGQRFGLKSTKNNSNLPPQPSNSIFRRLIISPASSVLRTLNPYNILRTLLSPSTATTIQSNLGENNSEMIGLTKMDKNANSKNSKNSKKNKINQNGSKQTDANQSKLLNVVLNDFVAITLLSIWLIRTLVKPNILPKLLPFVFGKKGR